MLVVFLALVVASCSFENPLSDDGSAATDGQASTSNPNTTADEDASGSSSGSGDGDGGGGDDEAEDPAEADPEPEAERTVEPLIEPDLSTVEQVAELPGRLAVGSGVRLTVSEPGGAELQVLDEGVESSASQPVWSDDGASLAWSRVSDVGHEVIVSDIGGGGPDVATLLAGPPAFYFQWSSDGETVAYLRNAQTSRGVELGLVAPGSGAVTLGVSAPFFIHWSPDGDAALAAHIGGNQVVELADPGSAFDGALVEPSLLLDPTAIFSTPTWIDDRTVLAVGSQGLVLIDVETLQTEVVIGFDGSSRQMRFVVSPDRTKVAYQLDRGAGAPTVASLPGRLTDDRVPGQGDAEIVQASTGSAVSRTVEAETGLVVVDLATETSEVVTLDTALRWEWSPTSDRLAWMEPIPASSEPLVRWNFWSDPENPVIRTPVHRLTNVLVQAYLPFFEQYVHSVSGWSPDGLAFAFAGRHEAEPVDAADSIWVQLIAEETQPVRVAEGDLVTWGP